MTPKGQLSSASVMRVPTSGWSLVRQHCCHLAFIPSLANTRAFHRMGLGGLDSIPLFLVPAFTLGAEGLRSVSLVPLPGFSLLGADAEVGGLTPSSESRPLTPASRMPVSINKS